MNNKKKPEIRGVTGYFSLDKEISPIFSDPLGSYTGKPQDIYEKPVQDADDL